MTLAAHAHMLSSTHGHRLGLDIRTYARAERRFCGQHLRHGACLEGDDITGPGIPLPYRYQNTYYQTGHDQKVVTDDFPTSMMPMDDVRTAHIARNSTVRTQEYSTHALMIAQLCHVRRAAVLESASNRLGIS